MVNDLHPFLRSKTTSAHGPAYADVVAAIQANGGPITMARFVEISLYGPHGFYATKVDIGDQGHFTTSPEVSPVFGRVTGRLLHRMWENMGHPARFDLYEFGPGNGTWMYDILNKLETDYPDFYARVQAKLIEVSPKLTRLQRERLAGKPVEWLAHSDLAAMPDRSVTGAIIANEMFDSVPAHALVLRDGKPHEIYVGLDYVEALMEVVGPVSPEVNRPEYFQDLKENIPRQASPQSEYIMQQIGRILDKGYTLFIDYGNSGARLSETHFNFMAYVKNDPRPRELWHMYRQPGEHDITMMVDFTALQRAGIQAGLETVSLTAQRDLMLAYGIIEEIKLLQSEEQRTQATKLFEEANFSRFYALIQRKGITTSAAG